MACQGNFLSKFAYAGAIRVPITEPCCWMKCSLLETKLFTVRIMRMRSQMDSVGKDLLVRWFRAIFQASSSFVEILVYREEMSMASISLSMIVFFMQEGSSFTEGLR